MNVGFAKAVTTYLPFDKLGLDGIGDKYDGWEYVAGRTTVAAISGGTASVIGGGKFENGAKTAALAHLLNFETQRNDMQWRDPILERARELEADGQFRFARDSALNTSESFSKLQENDFGVIVKEDRTLLQRFTRSGALNNIPDNKYSLTEAFVRTAYGPVQPKLYGYILAPAPIQNAVAVGIYRYNNTRVVDYNAYARSANAPVYVQSRDGGCVVYGAFSSRGC